MSFTTLITLTTAGSGTGPTFNLFGNNDGYSVPFATGITKSQLVSGYTCNVVPDNTTSIYVVSISGSCNGSFTQINISSLPPTPSPSVPAYYQVDILKGIAGGCGDSSSACYLYNVGTTPDYTIYTSNGQLSDGYTAYTDALGTTPFAGGPGAGYYYSDGYSYARISNIGYITLIGACGPGCP